MDTTRLPPDFSEFLKLLLAHEVRFLLIGGYAVNAFGYSRNTGDMDVWIARDRPNLSRAVTAVREFGFVNTPDDVLDREKAMLRLGVPPLADRGAHFRHGCGFRRLLDSADFLQEQRGAQDPDDFFGRSEAKQARRRETQRSVGRRRTILIDDADLPAPPPSRSRPNPGFPRTRGPRTHGHHRVPDSFSGGRRELACRNRGADHGPRLR